MDQLPLPCPAIPLIKAANAQPVLSDAVHAQGACDSPQTGGGQIPIVEALLAPVRPFATDFQPARRLRKALRHGSQPRAAGIAQQGFAGQEQVGGTQIHALLHRPAAKLLADLREHRIAARSTGLQQHEEGEQQEKKIGKADRPAIAPGGRGRCRG